MTKMAFIQIILTEMGMAMLSQQGVISTSSE
jgi:hypothetical protein